LRENHEKAYRSRLHPLRNCSNQFRGTVCFQESKADFFYLPRRPFWHADTLLLLLWSGGISYVPSFRLTPFANMLIGSRPQAVEGGHNQ
jgi:hypothetical protein